MNPLAVVGRIVMIDPIAGADRIVAATVVCGQAGKWCGVVNKDMVVGQDVTVFLQDAVLPPDERWAFMEKHKWRVRMARFKGVPSECLIIPATSDLPVGSDLTETLGVIKHTKPIPESMSGLAIADFPSFIPKTDEDNFQRVPEIVARMADDAWYVTEKADGTSMTAWNDEVGLHVCSRNWELAESDGSKSNAYWLVARKYGLDRLPIGFALQAELVGPGIQSNPMGLSELEVRAFTMFDIKEQRRLSLPDLGGHMERLGIPCAPILQVGVSSRSDEQLRRMAEHKYANGRHAEGIVVRALSNEWSFKVINLSYKEAT